MPTIGIIKKNFGVSEAFALYLIRSIEDYQQHEIAIFETPEAMFETCEIVIGANVDLEKMCFAKTSEHTLESLMGFYGYNEPLTAGGLVYAEKGHTALLRSMPQRYSRTLPTKEIEKNMEKDFRKIYEYFVEVLNLFSLGRPLQYPTPEKEQFLACLRALSARIDEFKAEEQTEEHFISFAEEISREIGERFEQTLIWYEQRYLPAFEALCCSAIQNVDNPGFVFCDYDFTQVSLNDLLKRASSNGLRFPRLLIRPMKMGPITKYRLESVKLVNPILKFPSEWIGNGQHIFAKLGIKDIAYISTAQDFAIANSLEAAKQLARKLIEHAEREGNVVLWQECPHFEQAGKSRPLRSLPPSREPSIEQSAGEREMLKKPPTPTPPPKMDEMPAPAETVSSKECLSSAEAPLPADPPKEDESQQAAGEAAAPINGGQNANVEAEGKENVAAAVVVAVEEEIETLTMDDADAATTTTEAESNAGKEENCPSEASSNSQNSPTTNKQPAEQFLQQNDTTPLAPQKSKTMQNGKSPANKSGNDEDDIGLQVKKIFRPIAASGTVVFMGVPHKDFTMAHAFAAAIIGHAFGNSERSLRLQTLDHENCLFRIGPDVYEFEDGERKITSAQKLSLRSFDIARVDNRLSVAGIAFVLHGKRAIAKIVSHGDREKCAAFLKDKNLGKPKIAAIFRRTHKRLVQPMDQFFEDGQQLPLGTPECDLFSKNLLGCTDASVKDKQMSIDKELGLSCFLTAFHIAMDFVSKVILAQTKTE